ncbi:hypothetical protein F4777DRAFT_173960 [Nemania sp. FL0916]|nr:hypothetical protein F4777DRAFT_173960 [Nemania sp. FL0916]
MGKEFDLGLRLQALTLHSEGYTRAAIIERTGYTPSGLSHLITTAKSRGYEPGGHPIYRKYVDNGSGRGRKRAVTDERKLKVLEVLTADEASLRLSIQQLADRYNFQNSGDRQLSRKVIGRMLEAEGFKRVNGTWQQPQGQQQQQEQEQQEQELQQ